jgi:hypothetical protein
MPIGATSARTNDLAMFRAVASPSWTRWIPPGVRELGRKAVAAPSRAAKLVRVWEWQLVRLDAQCAYLGRHDHAHLVASLLGLPPCEPTRVDVRHLVRCPRTMIWSELPMVGALRVPTHVRTIVTLGRSLDDILADYDPELRRKIRRLLERGYRTERVEDPLAVARVDEEMIEAFANARNAEHLSRDAVLRIAQSGRLDLLCCADEVIGAHLGYAFGLDGLRVWTTLRFGYPERIFRDAKRLADANTMNVHCALVNALSETFDAYDLGPSLARPDGGLLQFKRRRRGRLSSYASEIMHVRLPREGADRLLFESPIFAVEKGALDLHVGACQDEDELLARFKTLRFEGLRAVHLHASREPSEGVKSAIAKLYRGQTVLDVIKA